MNLMRKAVLSSFIGYCVRRVLLALSLSALVFAPNILAQGNDLEAIQNLIKQTQKALEQKLESSERLQQELKLAELEIAQTATKLNQTDTSLAQTLSEQNSLKDERSNIKRSITEQQSLLANQIKSAYMAGNYDFAKMIFNQDDAGKFERALTYYQYLNKARQEQIKEFRGLIAALQTVEQELSEKETRLLALQDTQKQQSDRLREQQQARHLTLQSLEKQIQTDTARVSALQEEEQALLAAIERAELEAKARAEAEQSRQSQVTLDGLSKFKGKLLRPSTGKLRALFGKRRQGQVRWKGVVFSSEQGVPVQAVHDGKVLYADWLKGFGLVTIVDHGQGYMTVYGRNQALLKKAGDTVSTGERIGLVGSSGGQLSSGLYFELRHKGKALNPTSWLGP